MSEILDKAIKCLKQTSIQEIEESKKILSPLTKNIIKLEGLIEDLFGCEHEAKIRYKLELENLKKQQKQLQNCITIGGLFPILDLEPLKWRNEKDLPHLVLFSLNDPVFYIKCEPYHHSEIYPVVPEQIEKCYDDIRRRYYRYSQLNDTYHKIQCSFKGLIPLETKEKIKKYKDLFEEIFIIAEPEWESASTDEDPLIVGWDGFNLWLVDKFDVSSIEEKMLEFSKIGAE